MDKNPPKVLVTYAHDTQSFADSALDFANKLRSDGIDANIDQYEESPPEGWPRWMERQVRESDFVIVICTETYMRKIESFDKPEGKGVNWEIGIIYQHLYDNIAYNNKFIPVIFPGSSTEDVPVPLKGATFYFTETEQSYIKLKNRLLGIKNVEKPEIGKPTPLEEKPRKTLFITSVIDLELWNRAGWTATLFAYENPIGSSPPILGVLCKNKLAIQAIFHGWIQLKGETKEFLRDMKISIIEGKLPKDTQEGYTVFLTSDIDEFINRIGLEINNDGEDMITTVSRYNTMLPAPGSKNLETFKENYKKSGYCYIVPAYVKDATKPIDGSNISFDIDYKLKFNNIKFQKVSDLGENDVESVILQ